ncbi:MAG: tRNA pseudouridine(55) synthase TruB [Acidobacteriota bacterium]
MDGIILVQKPELITSHDVVLKIRSILGIQKVGHFGTLDPMATGLLIIGVGKATRLFPFFSKMNKTYEGRIRLGFSTDTYDSTGKPTSEISIDLPSRDDLISTMSSFTGKIQQIPPPFSAKKIHGRPFYKLARQKKSFERKPVQVIIHHFKLKNHEAPNLEFEVSCSSGTYIRSLANDLGNKIGCRAHLTKLVRKCIGEFSLKDSFDLQEIDKLFRNGLLSSFVIPLENILTRFPKIILNKKGEKLIRHGNKITMDLVSNVEDYQENKLLFEQASVSQKDNIIRLFSHEGKLIALARKQAKQNTLHPFLVINQKGNNPNKEIKHE